MAWIDTPLDADVAQTYVLPAAVPIRAEQHDRIFRPDGLDVGVLADELDQACTENPVLVASLGQGITELCRAAAEASSGPAPTVSEHYARLGLRYLPYDVALRVRLADALRRLDRLDEAVIHGEAVVSIDRRDRSYQPAFWVAHASTLHQLGRNDEALAIVEDPGPTWVGVAGHAELVNSIRAASGMAPPPVVDDNTVARPETGAMPAAPPIPPSPSAPPPPPVAPTPPPAPPADHTVAVPAAGTAPEPAIVAPGPNTISDDHTVRFGGEEIIEPIEPEPEGRRRRGLLFPILLLIVVALAGALVAVLLGYVDLGADDTASPAGDGNATTQPTDDPGDDDPDPGDGEPSDADPGETDPGEGPDPAAVAVPSVDGFSASVARGLLERAGFEVTEERAPSYDADPGRVVATEPAADTMADPGTEITMFVALRPDECNDIGIVSRTSFTDIADLDTATRQAVEWAVDVDLVGDGAEFNPTKSTTRAVALTVLHRYMCEPTASTADFDDVPSDAFYADAVDWAASSGVVSGKSPSEFKPDDPITRAEFITIVWRAFGEPAAPDSLPFEDVPANAFYREALEWAHDEGIVNGTSPTTFDPEGDLDRVTTIVLFNRIEQQIDPLLGPFD